MTTIGRRIREARMQAGLSQQQLAEEMDLSRQAIGRWENDTVHPSTENLLKLSHILNIPLQQLAERPAEKQQPAKRRPHKLLLLAISVLAAVCFTAALYVCTRPVSWDAGACSGGFATAVYDRYAAQLTQRFLQNNEADLLSAQPLRSTQEATWDGTRIFLQFDVLCSKRDGSRTTCRLSFTGTRFWIMRYRWGGPVIVG